MAVACWSPCKPLASSSGAWSLWQQEPKHMDQQGAGSEWSRWDAGIISCSLNCCTTMLAPQR